MGWAERSNPNSEWNKKRGMTPNIMSSVQTSQKENVTVSTPVLQDEPIVIEMNPKSLWALFKEFLWRMLKPKSTRTNPPNLAPTS